MRVRGSWLGRVAIAVAVAAVCGGTLAASEASRGSRGPVAGNGWSAAVAISGDGRLIAFVSAASNLVAGDSNTRVDLFIYDRVSGRIERSDVPGATTLTPDFRFVAFLKARPGIQGEDCADLFVYDRVTGKTDQVDRTRKGALGAPGAIGDCVGSAALSANGRFVAFDSASPDLVSGDSNDSWDVFVRDLATGTTERVSVSSSGTQANGDSDGLRAISTDGRLVYFSSSATNLTADENHGDLFVRDRLTKTTRRVPLPPRQASNGVWSPGARFGAFFVAHLARDGAVLRPADLYVYEQATGKLVLVRVTKLGTHPDADVVPAAISVNGRYVVFSSSATNLSAPSAHARCVMPTEYDPSGQIRSPGYRYPCPNVYLTDRTTGELVTVLRGKPANDAGTYAWSRLPFVSADGRFLVFTSTATNLVPGRDTNKTEDVFLRDLKTHTTTLISAAR